jgi:V-containing nitrogenase delta subunit
MSMATALEGKLDDLFGYVQERCLWQFYSRTWDRQENIDGILGKVGDLLAGREPAKNTPADKLQCAEAKIMVADCRARFPWTLEVGEAEIRALMDGLKARLTDIAITRSKNRELNHHLY